MFICSRWGSATAAVLTLDTVVVEKDDLRKITRRAARSPARLCSGDGNLCFYRRLEHDFFLLFCSAYLSSSFSPSIPPYVSLLRVASSVKRSSVPLQQVRVLVS